MFSNLTNDQRAKRNQLKSQMDAFTSFKWQGHDMFDDYGMFIINEKKGGLKFYNGPSFSNEYSKPQFQEGMNNLLGVNVGIQTIELQVGIYYFTIAEYRKLLKLFSPYEIGDLIFSFNPNWRYKVKLKNMTDSPRYVVGSKTILASETSKKFTEYYYYTEWKLVFEVQGPNCLLAAHPYEWSKDENTTNNSTEDTRWEMVVTADKKDNLHEANSYICSDLEVPLDIHWSIPTNILETNTNVSLFIQDGNNNRFELFTITIDELPQMTITTPPIIGTYFNLHYMSEQGLLLWSIGNGTEELLTLRSSSTTGKRLLKSMKVLRYMLPGDGVDLRKYKLIFTPKANNDIVNIESYARTNAI